MKVRPIKEEPEKHGPLQYTPIAETIAVVAQLDLTPMKEIHPTIDMHPDFARYDQMVLVMSKRYKFDRFTAFVEAVGFKQRHFKSAKYEPYKQVVFEKIANVNF